MSTIVFSFFGNLFILQEAFGQTPHRKVGKQTLLFLFAAYLQFHDLVFCALSVTFTSYIRGLVLLP